MNQKKTLMTKWLKFNDMKLEEDYNVYFEINAKQKYRIFIYIECIYALSYIVNEILEYCYSNDEKIRQQSWLFIMVVCTLAAFGIFLTLSLLVIKNKLSSINTIDLAAFILSITTQFLINNPFLGQHNPDPCTNNRGYQDYWEGYAVQFHTFIICKYFNKWIYKFLYFGITSTYFYFYKNEIVDDRMIGARILGSIISYGIMVYYFEKANRLNYIQLRKLIEKEKMWKDITDSLPEGVLIVNKESKPLYINHILNSYMDKLEINKKENEITQQKRLKHDQEYDNNNNNNLKLFFDKILNLKLRNSLDDLRKCYKKSLSIFKKADKFGSVSVCEDIPDSIIDQEIKKHHPLFEGFSLNDLIKFTNRTGDSQYIFSIDDFITFDGNFQEKSLEIKAKNIQLEGESVLLMIFVDTTHRDLIARLEQNDKYKNIVLSTVSHELRTPLNSAISMIQTAIDATDISPIYKNELLHPSLRSLNMLASLINDILDYSQIQANKLNLVFQNVDLRQLVYDAHALFDIQCKKKGIQLKVDIAEEVPSSIRTDPNRLTQIILNLLSNAIKFTKKGYVKISVKWDDFKHGKAIITVEDTGIGIKPEELSKLFKEFGKIDLGENAKMNPTGCGLGLSISQKLAMRLGEGDSGGIKVESQVDKGSIFSFTIENKQDNKVSMEPNSLLNLNICSDNCDIQASNPIKLSRTSSMVSLKENESLSLSPIGLTKRSTRKIVNKIDIYQDINIQADIDEGARKNILNNKPMKLIKLYNQLDDHRLSPYTSTRSLFNIGGSGGSGGSTNTHAINCCEGWELLCTKPRLLIIDDDLINLYSLTIITKYLGYECHTANSVDEGLKLLQKDNLCRLHAPYDIIFMDFNMPDIDGLAATRIIKDMILKKELPSIFIVGCTAFLNETIKEKGIESGMDYIVEKPITKEKLLNIVNSFKRHIQIAYMKNLWEKK